MNPTHCEMKFLIHEQFLAFVEKFGKWNEKIRKLTLEKAKPNVTMRKLDGTFGIISEVSAHHPRINELVLTVPKITRTLPDPTERVLSHYTDIKSAVRDGWAIDLYDVEILNDLDPKE